MASTAADVITRARYQLNDIVADVYQWTDTELLVYITDGQREILQRRPDLYAPSGAQYTGVAVPDPGAVAATATTLKIMDMDVATLVSYVCARAHEKTGAGDPGKIQYYLQLFEKGLAV